MKLLHEGKNYGADLDILSFDNINTQKIKINTNLIVWKNDALNVTDLPLLKIEELKYKIFRKNLIYNENLTLLGTLEMSDNDNYINDIVSSIELEGN